MRAQSHTKTHPISGLASLEAQKDLSNGRGQSQYFPMFAYVAPLQMKKFRRGLWPFSTRAVEGRGGRYKRFKRRVICQRKRSSHVARSVRNVKLGTGNFKKSTYNSSMCEQLMKLACAQEDIAHGPSAHRRLGRTGRKTLVRTMPKWKAVEPPPMGNLLDYASLVGMLDRVQAFFNTGDLLGFETSVDLISACAGDAAWPRPDGVFVLCFVGPGDAPHTRERLESHGDIVGEVWLKTAG